VFSSPGPKAQAQMSFSHHFVTVVVHPLTFRILIFSRTTRSNWTKLWSEALWMLLFQNCICWPCLILKIAVIASDWLYNSGCQVILYSYIFKILLYFLYLPKISYITSQNPTCFPNYQKKKTESLILSGNFI
jgi:hypothetical protein